MNKLDNRDEVKNIKICIKISKKQEIKLLEAMDNSNINNKSEFIRLAIKSYIDSLDTTL